MASDRRFSYLGRMSFEDQPNDDEIPVAPGRFTGATMTILAFNQARESGPVVGTLFGKVSKGLRCPDGDALTVADFSGSVHIWVPRSVPKHELGIGKWFEFDVVAEQIQPDTLDLAAHRKAVTDAALNGDAEAAGALALDLIIALEGSDRPVVANAQRFVERM